MVIIGIVLMRIYLAGVVLLILNAVSTIAFKKRTPRARPFRDLSVSLVYAFVWPVAFFSPAGREAMLNRVNYL